MFKFLAGIVLVQAATVALMLVSRPETDGWKQWPFVVLALAVTALVAAFWFSALASHLRRDEVEQLRSSFAREREDLRVRAERDKTHLVRSSQKTIVRETRRAAARANLKVGAAFAAAAGVGLLMILSSFMTLGLLVMTGVGGALGGYLLRRKPPVDLPGARRLQIGGSRRPGSAPDGPSRNVAPPG